MDEIDQEQLDAATDIVTDMLSGATELSDPECQRLAKRIVKRVVAQISQDPADAGDEDDDDPEAD